MTLEEEERTKLHRMYVCRVVALRKETIYRKWQAISPGGWLTESVDWNHNLFSVYLLWWRPLGVWIFAVKMLIPCPSGFADLYFGVDAWPSITGARNSKPPDWLTSNQIQSLLFSQIGGFLFISCFLSSFSLRCLTFLKVMLPWYSLLRENNIMLAMPWLNKNNLPFSL